MSAQPIIAATAVMVVFFVALFGGYQIGAAAAERDNRNDTLISTER